MYLETKSVILVVNQINENVVIKVVYHSNFANLIKKLTESNEMDLREMSKYYQCRYEDVCSDMYNQVIPMSGRQNSQVFNMIFISFSNDVSGSHAVDAQYKQIMTKIFNEINDYADNAHKYEVECVQTLRISKELAQFATLVLKEIKNTFPNARYDSSNFSSDINKTKTIAPAQYDF